MTQLTDIFDGVDESLLVTAIDQIPHLENLIIFYTGAMQGENRAAGCELWDVYDLTKANFPDQTRTRIEIRIWKSDVSVMAAEIKRLRPRRVTIIGYSYGLGAATMRLLKLLEAMGIEVFLVISIDGVPNYGWRWVSNLVAAMNPSNEPIWLPANVKHYASFRTVTRENPTSPWGRSLKSKFSATPLLEVAIGRWNDLEQWVPEDGSTQRIRDVVSHAGMDGHPLVQSSIIKVLKSALVQGAER